MKTAKVRFRKLFGLSRKKFVESAVAIVLIGALLGLVISGHLQQGVSTLTVNEISSYSSYAAYSSQCVFLPNVPCPATITQTTNPTSITLPAGPYVLVTYHDLAATHYYGAFDTESQLGYVYLPIHMSIENHGYDSVSVFPGNFYVVIENQQFDVSEVTFHAHGWLPTANVLNGQIVFGYLVYEVPANVPAGWNLLWRHPSGMTVILVHT